MNGAVILCHCYHKPIIELAARSDICKHRDVNNESVTP